MPARRPQLDAEAARAAAAEAFLPSGRGLWGLEAERIVYRAVDPAARVTPPNSASRAGRCPGPAG
ncbi:MAG TPA: hypothetical protein VF951_01035 [Streptosporangiaceae bacterium]